MSKFDKLIKDILSLSKDLRFAELRKVLEFYGFPVGAVILSVADNSPASDAGLAKGDIITQFGNTAIKEYTMLEDLMKQCSPDDVVNVKIYRSGRYYTTKIKVGSNN